MTLAIIIGFSYTGYLSSFNSSLEIFDKAEEAHAAEPYCLGTPWDYNTPEKCADAWGIWYTPGTEIWYCGITTTPTMFNNETKCAENGYRWTHIPASTTSTSPPAEIICPSGTTKIGSGSSAYCEKKTYITSCPSGMTLVGSGASAYCKESVYITSCPPDMTLVGSGASAYCKQNVTQKENVNINIGDITGNLTGSDFGGANDHNSSLVINNGKVTDNHNTNSLNGYDSNFINFTNISSDGKITSLSNTFQPQFTVTYKGKILKAPKPTDVTQVQQYDKALSEFTSQAGTDINSHSSVEAILYKVDSIDELGKVTKDKDALIELFNKDSNQKYVKDSKIKYAHLNKQGLINYENFKVDQEGLYILGSKFVDQTKAGSLSEKTTYTFKPLEISFLNTAGYLPLSNYVVGQVNNMYMSVGLKKKDHGLTNLEYSNTESHYESMKVPSAYNYTNGFSALGSTNGGLKLLDPNLNDIKITSDTAIIENLKVTDVVEHGEGFYVSSQEGIFYLDTLTKKLLVTSVTNSVLDLEKKGDTIITLSEDKVITYFIVDGDLLPNTREHDLSGMFSSNKKAGKFELTGDILTVSTKDEGVGSEVVFLAAK